MVELAGLHHNVCVSCKEQAVGLFSQCEIAAASWAESCDLALQADPPFTKVVILHNGSGTAG